MTDVGGVHEWIEDNVTGILVSPKSPEEISFCILDLAASPTKRKYLGENARELILKKASKSDIMASVVTDYNSLLNRK
jgi:glycosyltransferase involved in cell wall biosynthesis